MLKMKNIPQREPLKKYFYGGMSWINIVMIIAIILASCEWKIPGFILVAFVCIVIKIILMVRQPVGRASDEALYDKILADDIKDLKARSTDVMGLIKEEFSIIEPLVGVGYAPKDSVKTGIELNAEKKNLNLELIKDMFKSIPMYFSNLYLSLSGKAPIVSKSIFYEGKDKKIRGSLVRVVVVRFTEQQIVAYTCNYDIALGTILEEYVREVFYREVDSVNYGGETIHVTTKDHRLLHLTEMWLKLAVASGNNIVASLTTTENILDDQVMAVKSLVRNKKEELA